MKFLPVLISLGLTFAARADMVIVQKVEGAGQSGEMTMKFKGDKIRADVSPQVSTITDATTGDVTTLMPAQKSYMIIPASSTKALMEQMQKQMQQQTASGSPAPNPKPVATGRKETINGYETEEYTCQFGGMKVEYWIAPNFPNWANVLAAMTKFQQGGLAAMTKGLMPSPSDFKGMPIKTEVDMNGQKITTTLVSVNEQPVADTEFQIPAGYTQMKMPSFNMPQQ